MSSTRTWYLSPCSFSWLLSEEGVFLTWQQAKLVWWCVQDNSCTEGRTQRYREAPAKIEKAVDYWLAGTAELNFVLSLGDIINGNSAEPVIP